MKCPMKFAGNCATYRCDGRDCMWYAASWETEGCALAFGAAVVQGTCRHTSIPDERGEYPQFSKFGYTERDCEEVER